MFSIDVTSHAMPLVGREDELAAALKKCEATITSCDSDIPMFCGISGIGKTRMLGEVIGMLQRTMEHKWNGVIVSFNKEESARLNLPVEAELAWRLLFHSFVDGNSTARSFGEWFDDVNPGAANTLTLSEALETIATETKREFFFLGVDSIENIQSSMPNAPSSFTTLVSCIKSAMESHNSAGLRLVPMLAGGPSTLTETHDHVIFLTLGLLSEDNSNEILRLFGDFSKLELIHRHLFYIGGIPGHIIDYLSSVDSHRRDERPLQRIPSKKMVTKIFKDVRKRCIGSYDSVGTLNDRVRLAAFAVSGSIVSRNGVFIDEDDKTWDFFESISWCTLTEVEPESEQCAVRVPYFLLINIGKSYEVCAVNTAERAFAEAAYCLHEDVDLKYSAGLDWDSWEVFGTLHYALRINSMLLRNERETTMNKFWDGAIIGSHVQSLQCVLTPVQSVRSADAFGPTTLDEIRVEGNTYEKIRWRLGEHIVQNGVGGKGSDIFFNLHVTSNCIDGGHGSCEFTTIIDQRRLVHKKIGKKYIKRILKGAVSSSPTEVDNSIGVLMASTAPLNLKGADIPKYGVVAREQTPDFYGMFTNHPATGYMIAINAANDATLRTLFNGNAARIDEIICEIVAKRLSIDTAFSCMRELDASIQEINKRHNDANPAAPENSTLALAKWAASAVRFTG